MTAHIKQGFSSNDLFNLRFGNLTESLNPTLLAGLNIQPETIKCHKKIFGTHNHMFEFLKFKDILHPIALKVKKEGLFSVNLSKEKILDSLKCELIVLQEKLSFWWEFCRNNDIETYKTPDWYFLGSIEKGPDFALALKDTFDYSLRKTMSTYPFSIPEDVKEVTSLKDLNSIFPPQHLLNWKINPDYTDVTDYSFKKYSVNDRVINNIKDTMRKLIKKSDYEFVMNKGHAANLFTIKKMYSKGKNVPSHSNKSFDMTLSSDYLLYNITHVTKSPCEGRICAVADDLSRNTLYVAREKSKYIFTGGKMNYYGKKPWVAESKLHEDGSTFIMFDQKKCGWTFPFELLIAAFEVAFEKTNDHIWLDLVNIYKNGNIYYDICGERRTPLRGFTLGMWDNVLSFIMECVFLSFLDEHINEEIHPYLEGMFFGDDSVIKIIKPHECPYYIDIYELWAKWLDYNISIGIEINTKKSFFAEFGIFCEMYGDNSILQNHKTCMYLLNAFDILYKDFTFERKICLSSWSEQMAEYVNFLPKEEKNKISKYIDPIKKRIIIQSEAEFDEYDHCFPLEMGGWFREIIDGKSMFVRNAIEGRYPTQRLKVSMCMSFQDFVISRFSKNKSRERFLEHNPWALEQNLFNLETVIRETLVRKSDYYLGTDNAKKLTKAKEQYALYRKGFFNDNKYTIGDIKHHLYTRSMKNQHFHEDLFTDWYPSVGNNHIRGFTQTPHNFPSGFNENELGSLDMLNKYLTDPEAISIRRHNIANLYKDICMSKYPIHIRWFKFMKSNMMSFDELYERIRDIGLDFQNIVPKYAVKKEEFSTDLYPLQKDFLYWDDITCTYYECTEDEASMLAYKSKEEISKILFDQNLRTDDVNYYMYLSHMAEPEADDTESDFDDEKDLEDFLNMHRAPRETEIPEETETEYVVPTTRTVLNLADIEDDYEVDSDEEKTGPGYFKGVYIRFIDPDHEDYDWTIHNSVEHDIPLDPVEYQDEIREFPQLGATYNDSDDDNNSYHDQEEPEEEEEDPD
jgi:hypothetical protein